MCGICGIIDHRGEGVDPGTLRRMTASLAHRGPDDEGIYVHGSLGLGHRRLSVIDLTERGRQPMSNEDGSLRIVCNGEIYNFRDLRRSLEAKGHVFRSRSDTEVILHLYEEKGAGCLDLLRGMFAFALWDGKKGELFLARDRVGKKPLYYMATPGMFAFASEIKAILADGTVPRRPEERALHHYLTYQYVPSPWTAFEGILTLPPAHFMTVREGVVTTERYWKLSYRPKTAAGEEEAERETLAALREAVQVRLESDVPLGAFLSGGLDSSAVVALMAEAMDEPVKTFSIGFEEEQYDELSFAKTVAEKFETDHREFIVRPDALEVIDRLVWHYNQPFADPSAVPMWYVSRMAGEHVTVVLSGDGGDESFAGYHRYVENARSMVRQSFYPPRAVAETLLAGARIFAREGDMARGGLVRRLLEKLNRTPEMENALRHCHFSTAEKRSLYTDDFRERLSGEDSFDLLLGAMEEAEADGFLDRQLSADVAMYLPDDLLVKADVATMAHSLEARSPFLDHRFMEHAARLPGEYKLRGRRTKHLLKEALGEMLPAGILDRPKMGFGVPLARWFRRELKEMTRDILLGERALTRGYFRKESVGQILELHLSGREDRSNQLWNLLMLELWHRMFIDGDGPITGPPEGAAR